MSPKVQKSFSNLQLSSSTKFVIKTHSSSLKYGKKHERLIHFIFDGGALAKSGNGYSFSTPGSPSWDKFMSNSPASSVRADETKNKPIDYLSKARAQKAFKGLHTFYFDDIVNVSFLGIRDLNNALNNLLTYPVDISIKDKDNKYIRNAQVFISNIKQENIDKILLTKGSHAISIMAKGYEDLYKTINVKINSSFFGFSSFLESQKVDVVLKKKKQLDQNNANDINQSTANELDDMFADVEGKDKANKSQNEDNVFSDQTISNNKELSLDNIFTEIAQRDEEKAQALYLRNMMKPIKKEYKLNLGKCEKNKPYKPLNFFECPRYIGSLLTMTYGKPTKAEIKRSEKRIARKRREEERRWEEDCKQKNRDWKIDKNTYPQRIKAWHAKNKQCKKDAYAKYLDEIKAFEKNGKDIESLWDD